MKNNKENRFTNQIAEMTHSENNQVLPAYNKMETLTFHPRLMKLRKWAIENTIFFKKNELFEITETLSCENSSK